MKLPVVEHAPLIQRAPGEMIEAWGYACDTAADGEEAREMVRCLINGRPMARPSAAPPAPPKLTPGG